MIIERDVENPEKIAKTVICPWCGYDFDIDSEEMQHWEYVDCDECGRQFRVNIAYEERRYKTDRVSLEDGQRILEEGYTSISPRVDATR